jgi:membrane-bound metal-dependent hydrolase YbcI (DUF457 family)
VVAGVVLTAVDQTVYQMVGSAIGAQGPLDELAHLLTTMIIVWAVVPAIGPRPLLAALVASCAIDLDHVPGTLGHDWLTAGTSRPYTHSLLTIAVLLSAAKLSRSHRAVVLGLALGVCSHLWRDLAEPAGAGVALLWPASDTICEIPAGVYLFGLGGLGALAFARAAWASRRRGGRARRGWFRRGAYAARRAPAASVAPGGVEDGAK